MERPLSPTISKQLNRISLIEMEPQHGKMVLTITDLSAYLNIKKATLYKWAEQNKIPHVKIHGLIRFKKEEIDQWIESFKQDPPESGSPCLEARGSMDVDLLVERAKREVYNSRRGETRSRLSPERKVNDGAL